MGALGAVALFVFLAAAAEAWIVAADFVAGATLLDGFGCSASCPLGLLDLAALLAFELTLNFIERSLLASRR